jgi:glycosyltransferase involved in cell wall biosynthesis
VRIKFVSCWFNTSYAAYTDCLRKALERQTGGEVGVIASNCGCGDPMDGVFFDRSCEYFEYPHLGYWRSKNPVKRWLRQGGRELLYRERAKRYMRRSGAAQVLHFQQTLNGYGSLVVSKWLSLPSAAVRVVTVHELDLNQTEYPRLNGAYNLADRVLVHDGRLRQSLISLGVDPGKIALIHHGVDLQPRYKGPRQGLIFFGGHHLNPGKGLETLCRALALASLRLGERTPRLKVHGYYGDGAMLDYGRQCAADAGVSERVDWLGRLDLEAMHREYRHSLACVIPFVGSFAGLPASLAMANDVPVIGTRFAGLPEHLGEAGIYVQENSPAELADAIVRLVEDGEYCAAHAAAGRDRAERLLSWDVIAAGLLDIYRRAAEARKGRAAAGSAA